MSGTDLDKQNLDPPVAPEAHASTHEGGSDPVSPAGIGAEPEFSKNTGFNKNLGSGAGDVCEGNDPRLSDARTPLAHKGTHEGGSDPVTPAGIGAEPAFSKNTGFNKNFGKSAADVANGIDGKQAHVTCAGASPAASDFAAWPNDSMGFCHDTGGTRHFVYKDGAGNVYGVSLSSIA